jgi:hypothetical protein
MSGKPKGGLVIAFSSYPASVQSLRAQSLLQHIHGFNPREELPTTTWSDKRLLILHLTTTKVSRSRQPRLLVSFLVLSVPHDANVTSGHSDR